MTTDADRLSWRLSMAPAAILLAQGGLYLWMAPRGFEFTDEAFYFLNYLYWRDLTATVSFFGAYFEWPFRLLGQSIAGIRVLSLVALVVAGGFFSLNLLRFSRRSDVGEATPLLPLTLVGVAGSFFYFAYFSSVRAPSYNLLALCAMLVATGLLLRLGTGGGSAARLRTTAMAYGLVLGACGLSKPPAAALTLLAHAMFFAVVNEEWRPHRVVELVGWILAGIATNVAILQWAHPTWLSALREGVAVTTIVGHGGLASLAGDLAQEVKALTPAVLELSGFAALIVLLGRNIRHNRRAQVSIAVVAVIGACSLELVSSRDRRLWLPTLVLTALVLWSFETPWRMPRQWTRRARASLVLSGLLFLLPLAFSFGTNLPVFEHSQMAAVFGIAALLIRLQALSDRHDISRWAIGASLALLCVPTLSIQIENTFDPRHAYRLRSALIDQTTPTVVGPANAHLLLDTTTRDLLASITTAAREAGFAPRQQVLDLTGDGPGIVYAIGGRPLGVGWLSGGYSGSEAAATRLIARLPLAALRDAWLLTSSNNPRRIVGWQRMVDGRLGVGAHEWVATIPVRSAYLWHGDVPERSDVELWRPLSVRASRRQ